MRFLFILLLTVLAIPAGLFADIRLRVVSDTAEKDLAWMPLSFRVQGDPDLPGAKVRRLSDGKELPAQLERIKGGVIVHWVSPRLAAGSRGAWSLELQSKAPKKNDRVRVLTQGTGSSRIDIDGQAFSSYVYGGKGLFLSLIHI